MKSKNPYLKLKIKMLISLNELQVWNKCPTLGRIQLGISMKDFYSNG